MSTQERTIGRLWRDAVAARHSSPPYLAERESGWQEVSWADAARRVDDLANGLLALGVKKGDAFGILVGTRVEWAQFDFALALVGGVTAPVYANSSPADCAYVLAHSESVGVLVEDDDQLAKIDAVRAELPGLEHVLTVETLDDLAARGREFAAANPTALADAESSVSEDDLFTYIYTSGTTGPPKGCMIRHRNYYAMVTVRDQMDDNAGPGDVLLLYLPLAHNFGRLIHLSGPYAGFTLAFCADPYKLADALLAVRPTVLPQRPTHLREGPRGGRRGFRRGDRRQAEAYRLGARRRRARLRPPRGTAASTARPRHPAPPGEQARLREGEGAARRTATDRAVRAPRSRLTCCASSTRSTS